MKQVQISTLPDGTLLKRKAKSSTWFKLITKGSFGAVVTSIRSEYSAIVKLKTKVFIKS